MLETCIWGHSLMNEFILITESLKVLRRKMLETYIWSLSLMNELFVNHEQCFSESDDI